MIEPSKYGVRVIGETPFGGTYHIATFFNSHTGDLLTREKADAVLICVYDDNDYCVYHTKLLKKGASPIIVNPPWLRSYKINK